MKLALSLEEVSPENMLAKDYINKENFLLYKELYNNVLEKQNIDNFIVHLKLSNTWKWFRINYPSFQLRTYDWYFRRFYRRKKSRT